MWHDSITLIINHKNQLSSLKTCSRAAIKSNEAADEFVCVRISLHFSAAGDFYIDFTQVSDEEVVSQLAICNDNEQGVTTCILLVAY
jgi:hypothetical protein